MTALVERIRGFGRHELVVATVRRVLPFALMGGAFGLFWYAGSYRTEIGWNVIDLGIGRKLLRGEGFVDFPGAYHRPFPGDGVRLTVLIVDGSGEEREGFDLWIDPKNNTGDRLRHDFSVDLSPYVGQTVELVLAVKSGGDPEFDNAGWANMRLTPLEGS